MTSDPEKKTDGAKKEALTEEQRKAPTQAVPLSTSDQAKASAAILLNGNKQNETSKKDPEKLEKDLKKQKKDLESGIGSKMTEDPKDLKKQKEELETFSEEESPMGSLGRLIFQLIAMITKALNGGLTTDGGILETGSDNLTKSRDYGDLEKYSGNTFERIRGRMRIGILPSEDIIAQVPKAHTLYKEMMLKHIWSCTPGSGYKYTKEALKQDLSRINQILESSLGKEKLKQLKEKEADNVIAFAQKKCREKGVSFGILLEILSIESGGNPFAFNNSSYASGLAQFLPKYWRGNAERLAAQGQNATPGIQAAHKNPSYWNNAASNLRRQGLNLPNPGNMRPFKNGISRTGTFGYQAMFNPYVSLSELIDRIERNTEKMGISNMNTYEQAARLYSTHHEGLAGGKKLIRYLMKFAGLNGDPRSVDFRKLVQVAESLHSYPDNQVLHHAGNLTSSQKKRLLEKDRKGRRSLLNVVNLCDRAGKRAMASDKLST